MREPKPRYLVTVFAVAGLALAAVSGCSASSSNPSPSPTSSQQEQLRLSYAPALLVQCMLSQGTLKPTDKRLAGQSDWLHDAKVSITQSNGSNFYAWYEANSGITVASKALGDWVQWAASNDKLPSAVCGSSTSASTLQKEVYAQDPKAGDPW